MKTACKQACEENTKGLQEGSVWDREAQAAQMGIVSRRMGGRERDLLEERPRKR